MEPNGLHRKWITTGTAMVLTPFVLGCLVGLLPSAPHFDQGVIAPDAAGSSWSEFISISKNNLAIGAAVVIGGWVTLGIGSAAFLLVTIGLAGIAVGVSLATDSTTTLLILAPHLLLELAGFVLCAASGVAFFFTARSPDVPVRDAAVRALVLSLIAAVVLIVASGVEATISRSIAVNRQALAP